MFTLPLLTSSANSFLMLLALTVNYLIFQFIIFSACSLLLVGWIYLQRLTSLGVGGGGNPVGSRNPLIFEFINSNLYDTKYTLNLWHATQTWVILVLLVIIIATRPTYWICFLLLQSLLWKIIQHHWPTFWKSQDWIYIYPTQPALTFTLSSMAA